MAGVVKKTEFIYADEILKGPSGLDDVRSYVLDASLCNTSISGVAGRYFIPAGSVLVKSDSWTADKKVAPLYMNDGTAGMGALLGSGGGGAYVAGDIIGILGRDVELIVDDSGTTPGAVSDQDVPVIWFNAHFDISALWGYNDAVDAGTHGDDNSTIVKAALPHCVFS